LQLSLFDVDALEQSTNRPSFVYIAEVSGGFWKIGYTTRPIEQRMRELNATLIAVRPGGKAEEQMLHGRFGTHRIAKTERFYPTSEMCSLAMQWTRTYRQPIAKLHQSSGDNLAA
jgi:hypothetical protein